MVEWSRHEYITSSTDMKNWRANSARLFHNDFTIRKVNVKHAWFPTSTGKTKLGPKIIPSFFGGELSGGSLYTKRFFGLNSAGVSNFSIAF